MQYIYLDDDKQWFASKGGSFLVLYHDPCSEFGNRGRGACYNIIGRTTPAQPKISTCSICKKTPPENIMKKYRFLYESDKVR